jgi:hypothetical protein
MNNNNNNSNNNLRQGSGMLCTIPAENGAKLRILIQAIDRIFIRTEETPKYIYYRL